MSTPNPTHIDVIAKHADFVGGDSIRHCSCGRWHSTDGQGQHSRLAHAEHVVSKLGDAGYSIVQLPELDDLDCVSAAPGSGKVRCYLDDARMTADDARDLAGLLLAAAAAAEGEKP